MDFTVITQSPVVRRIVQEGILERQFHDALFPKLLFRSMAEPVEWPAHIGDSTIFTGAGLITPKLQPLRPGVDPLPSTYALEQWSASLNQYADSIDTHMPTSVVAIADQFLRNAQQLGLSAGMTLNRLVRNRLYAAGLSGHTLATAQVNAGAVLVPVARLNGLTTARRPDLALGSPVAFLAVSTTNPQPVRCILDDGTWHTTSITAFTPTNVGDEYGPGTVTLAAVVPGGRFIPARGAVQATDRTSLVRVGGGETIDAIGANDRFTFAALRTAVARLRYMNVPEMPDGYYFGHIDPIAESQFFSDAEVQRMLTSLPDYFMYKQFAIGAIGGAILLRNNEVPLPETVDGGLTAAFSMNDPFAGELWTTGATTGVRVHRTIIGGQGGIYEYYKSMDDLITEAGITGKRGEPRVSNNGIEVQTDRVDLIIRAPLNRLQDSVSTSWKFIGDWPCRTDITSGDGARYKRCCIIESGE